MIRVIATMLAICLYVGIPVSDAHAQSNSASHTDPGAAFSDAGERIKQGATNIGHGIKEGAETVGEKIKNTAIDVWESGKAAVSAGTRTMDERKAERPPK